MKINTKKLREYLCTDGKYVKNNRKFFYLDCSNSEEDYVIVNGHYVLVMGKDELSYNENIKDVHIRNVLEEEASKADDIEYLGLKYDKYDNKKAICRFGIKGCSESEEVWINRLFFTEFINRAFSSTNGFANGITFTGSDPNHMIFMWMNDDLVGAFLPIKHK